MAEIVIILGLIIINGLFSMAEIALLSSRKTKLELQAQKGDDRAKAALELANHPDTFLSTVQIGITLITILTGIFSGDKLHDDIASFLDRFEPLRSHKNSLATTILVIIITYLSVVIGELVPKRIGLSKPEAIAKIAAGPMRVISLITYPFVWLLTKSTKFIVTIFNIKKNENQVTEEEIKAMINEGTEHGAIEETEQEIIERVFHLGDRNITSLMTHRSDIMWLAVTDTVATVKRKINEEIHNTYPVCEEAIDKIKGVVTIKEILLAPDDAVIETLMKPALFVPENNSVYQLLEKFKKSKINSCFIVDEYGSLEGMITLNDILEAMVGDMAPGNDDDYEITKRDNGSYLIDAQLPFYDFLSYFQKTDLINEGEQDFNTVAGFILHELKQIPKTGDRFEWEGFEIEIVDMDGHRIDKVLIKVSQEISDDMDN